MKVEKLLKKQHLIIGEYNGEYLFYDENGKLIKKEIYINGDLISKEEF